MRTTLDLPDDLFRQAKAKAALEGKSLKELLAHFVESGLRERASSLEQKGRRSKLPVIKRRKGSKSIIPNLTSGQQAELEENEDLARLHRSFGR